MKSLWSKLGRVAFWLSWPALFVYLRSSKRTRVLVVCGHEVLVVKGWLGVGRWELPGGGRHQNESSISCAIRELFEETGLKVKPNQLNLLHEQRSIAEFGLTFFYTAYVLELETKPKLIKQRGELVDLRWMNWQDLNSQKAVSPNTRSIATVWFNP